MPNYIIQHENVYNIYSTVSDGCWFESGLALEELKEWYASEYGKSGMADFDLRIERCLQKGTSSLIHDSLKNCVRCNRAGPKESRLQFSDFVNQYLTIRRDEDIIET